MTPKSAHGAALRSSLLTSPCHGSAYFRQKQHRGRPGATLRPRILRPKQRYQSPKSARPCCAQSRLAQPRRRTRLCFGPNPTTSKPAQPGCGQPKLYFGPNAMTPNVQPKPKEAVSAPISPPVPYARVSCLPRNLDCVRYQKNQTSFATAYEFSLFDELQAFVSKGV